jgi:hypothetical protein
MSFHSSLVTLACVAVLAGCASAPPAAPPAPPTLAALMAQAEAAVAAKQETRAIMLFKQASQAYPGDKSSWLRMAQVSFDCESYGDTITYAQAASALDPNDMKALSLVAVSGLRVSSRALSDLSQKNNVTGTVRMEAQNLAKLLRTSIGGDIIVPPKKEPKKLPKAVPFDINDPFRELRDMERNANAGK